MKRFLLTLATLSAVLTGPVSASAQSVLEGRWKNGKMEIMIRPCGNALCGTVVKASARQQARARDGSGTNLLGARVINNIEPAGPGLFKADVYLADRDINAHGTIEQVNANRLTVRGCVFVFLCKTTHWDRVG